MTGISSTTRVEWDDPDIEVRYNFCTYRGEPFSGELVEHYPDGQLSNVERYVDGEVDGPQRIWYPDGSLQSETMTSRGRTIGLSRTWYPSGQLKDERVYDGVAVVSRRTWAEDGTLTGDEDWTQPG
jgi:antitoxin component YwqK of YwqJK toxin-antitoxin module